MKVYIRLLFAFLGACFLVFSYVCLNYLWTDKIEPKKQLSQEVKKLKKLPVKDVDYGLPLYDDAMALIRKERVYEGISKLHDLLKLYPDSSKCDEANDILGEYNCDNLFSRKENKFKTEYEVKRGDALNSDPKYHNPGEITAQIVIGSILSFFSLFVLMLTVINRGRFLSSDDESFTTEHGLQVAFNEIKKIDTRNWNKKGLAYVYYINDKGLSARAVIDDLKYKGADEILERIKSEFTGELIENAPNILQTED